MSLVWLNTTSMGCMFCVRLFFVITSQTSSKPFETGLKECKRSLPSSISGAELAMTEVAARARQASDEMV